VQIDTPGVRRRNMARHLPYGDMPLLGRLGVSFSRAEDGHSEGEWRPAHEACNPRGSVQGGLFSMAFDATMSMAILSALPPEDTCVSLEIKTSTPGAARPREPLRLSGRVVRLGGTVIFAEASATMDGELIATSSGTFLRRRKPPKQPTADA
jgi:uncharacterized protein (TIGR00369 family)